MTSLQEHLLILLKEIDEICIEHDIDYYVFAGTMLGVERNEGFLPWDDDIDLIMTEENYHRFCAVMKQNKIENRVFECIDDNDEYPLQFGRYTSTDTTGLTRSLGFGNSNPGIWVDMIYVAPLPVDRRKAKRIEKWFSIYCEIENQAYVEYDNHYDGFYWRYTLAKWMTGIFGKQRVLDFMRPWFNGFSEEECEYYFLYHSLFTDFRIFEKKMFEKPVRKKFENIEVNVSPYNREFSRLLYGDSWMIVPKADNQEVHTIIFDYDLPYEKYVNDYMCFLDKKQVMDTMDKVKTLQLFNYRKLKKTVSNSILLKGVLIVEELKSRIRKEAINLKMLADDGAYSEIEELYRDYLELQLSKDGAFSGVFIPVDDELLYPVLKKLVCCDGKYYVAQKILKLRNNSRNEALSSDLQRLEWLIEKCRTLSAAVWDRENMAEAEQLTADALLNPDAYECADLMFYNDYVKLSKASGTDELSELKEEVVSHSHKFTEYKAYMKLIGDIEFALGNLEEAWSLYNEAKWSLNNGLMLLDIEKRKKDVFNGEN